MTYQDLLFEAQDGERIGLVNIVVPHDQLDAEVAHAFAWG
jgi:1,4-dihydroxy-2-naphthoyl-CoA synthase